MATKTIAQLIAEVKADGVPAFDRDMGRVDNALDRAANKARKTAQHWGLSFDSIRQAASVAATASVFAIGALVAGVAKLEQSAFSKAIEIDNLSKTFQALGGSAEYAQRQLSYIKNFSQLSLLHSDDVKKAGTLLEASELNIRRILPLIGNLGGAFSATSEDVQELARGFSLISAGSFGEGLETLRQFGVTRKDLEAEGLKFTKGGELVAEVLPTLEAIERVTNRKFGNISSTFASSIGVQISNLQDGWDQLLERMGRVWFPFVSKVATSLTPVLNFLSNSDTIDRVFKSVTGGLQALDLEKVLIKPLFYAFAYLENLPNHLSKLFDGARSSLTVLGDILVSIANISVSTIKELEPILNVIPPILSGIAKTVDFLDKSGIGKALLNPFGPFPHVKRGGVEENNRFERLNSELSNFERLIAKATSFGFSGTIFPDTKKRGEELFAAFKNTSNTTPTLADPTKESFFTKPQVKAALETAANTEQIAREQSEYLSKLEKYVLGGGRIASIGATAVEIGAARRGGNGSISVQVTPSTGKNLDRAVADIVLSTIDGLIRQGLLRGQ